jgi:arylsulfatase A-like enzyme/Flp pilus assembly protein TadD
VIRSLLLIGLMALGLLLSPIRLRAAPKSRLPQSRANVILITMDTLRADHLGCYGDKQIETPTLDVLAQDSVVFDRAIVQVPLTWPSHTAILTGTYPFQNGVQDFTGHPLSPQFRTLAQAFKQSGYATGAVVSSFVLDRSWGLARGFDYYDDAFSAAAFQQKDIGLVDRIAAESVGHALQWLQRTPHRPFFLWLHLYDPHSPYDPPEPYRTQYHNRLYDGEIAYADHELGRLVAWLKSARLYDNTAIAFLSDHGESLGDHGEKEHGFFIYNATVRVPLIVKPPAAAKQPPTRIAATVESIAVAPTLLALAGVKDPIQKQFQAASLLAESDKSDDAPAYSETFYPFSSFGWNPLHAVETSRFHFIDAPQPELYDVVADPEEKNNIAAQQTATVAVLKDKLQQRLKASVEDGRARPSSASSKQGPGLSPDAAEKLRALGYVAYQSPVSVEALAAGLPDPKAKLWEFRSILEAQDAFHEGNDDQAEAILRNVQGQDPTMYVIPFMMGESALRGKDWQNAADELQRCLALNPNFDNAMTGLARALSKLGRVGEAKTWLTKALQINPANYRAWYETGLLEAEVNPAAALSDYQKAIAIQSNYSPGQRELGLALFQAKRYAAATLHLEKAIALGLDDAHIRNFLGICYSQTNRLQKSIESYRIALKFDPRLAEAHLNLAYALRRAGKIRQAKAEYATACQLEAKFCGSLPQ